MTDLTLVHDGELTAFACEVLRVERVWWNKSGYKEQYVREKWGLGTTHYHQIVNQLLDEPASMSVDPVTVNRLRRIRARRREARSRRTLVR